MATNHAASVMERFYAQYEAWPSTSAKETLKGFQALLDIQHDRQALALARYGIFEEWFVVLEKNGKDVGAANFSVMTVRGNIRTGPAVGIHVSHWIFSGKGEGVGMSGVLFDIAREIASRHAGKRFMIFEMDDPLKISAPVLQQRVQSLGFHPADLWSASASWGAKILCFPYSQPSLDMKGDGGSCSVLFTMEGRPLDAVYLQQHLETLFNLSILKGVDCRLFPQAQSQIQRCVEAGDTQIQVICPRPYLQKIREAVGDQHPWQDNPKDTRLGEAGQSLFGGS